MTTMDGDRIACGLDFRATRLPQISAGAGYDVECDDVRRYVEGTDPWFYPLRPYGVPDLTGAFAKFSPELRDHVRAGSCYIVIDYAHEGFSEWMFYRVYEVLRVAKLPAHQLILISGDLNARQVHVRYCQANAVRDPIHVESLNYFAQQVNKETLSSGGRSSHVRWNQALAARARPHLFLSFNRRNRLHRLLATVMLHRRGLFERGLVSLPDRFEGRSNEEAFADESVRFGLSSKLAALFRNSYPALEPLLPLTVDANEMATNHAHTHTTWPYLVTWLSLVSETLFFESARGQVFVSEKIFKPMANFHPFLLIGDAYSLKALRGMGFRTFHPYIDESYDEEVDHEKRLTMVLDEIGRLSDFSSAMLRDWFLAMQSVLAHNVERLRGEDGSAPLRIWEVYASRVARSISGTCRASDCRCGSSFEDPHAPVR